MSSSTARSSYGLPTRVRMFARIFSLLTALAPAYWTSICLTIGTAGDWAQTLAATATSMASVETTVRKLMVFGWLDSPRDGTKGENPRYKRERRQQRQASISRFPFRKTRVRTDSESPG